MTTAPTTPRIPSPAHRRDAPLARATAAMLLTALERPRRPIANSSSISGKTISSSPRG
jgi:hypothetical protein